MRADCVCNVATGCSREDVQKFNVCEGAAQADMRTVSIFRTWLIAQTALSARRADLVAAGLGAVSVLALPPIHLVPVLLLAIPGLLILIAAAPTTRAAARRGWWFGFGLNLLGLYWITEAILVEAARYWWLVPLAVPALAAFMAGFVAAPAAIAKRAGTELAMLLALGGTWTLSDIVRQFILSGFPWNLWGTAWAIPGLAGDILLQPVALIGAHGLGLITLLLAGAPLWGRRALVPMLAVVSVWAGISAWRLNLPAPAETGRQIVLIQGNIAQGQKWDRARAMEIFRHYLQLTADGVAQTANGTAIVVWPETASPFLLEQDPDARAAIANAANGQPVLAGSVRWDAQRRPRNSLIPILARGDMGPVYDKWHLVPFGEVQPGWFPLPIQIVPGGGFAAGPGPQTIRLPDVPPFGPLICYEAIFGGEIVDRTDRPAWLVNITNDAWFGQSAGPYQHLAAARMRAVEEGLPLVRAANTGVSAVYDGFGHERGRLRLGQTGILSIPLPGAAPPSLFATVGLAGAITLTMLTLLVSWFSNRHRF